MKKLLITITLSLAMYSILTLLSSPFAYAQRIEPQVPEVDASARVRVEAAKLNDVPAKKSTQWMETHSSWATSDAQHSQTFGRAADLGQAARPTGATHFAGDALARVPSSVASASQTAQTVGTSHPVLKAKNISGHSMHHE